MSASSSEDAAKAVANTEGSFGSHVAPTGQEDFEGSGHQPGRLVSEADKAPESTIKTLPSGSAPASKTFTPNPTGDDSIPGQGGNPNMNPEEATSASDTLRGATSSDVHTGLGHPGSGQSSKELRDNSNAAGGLQGVGASGAASHTQFASSKVDTTTSVAGATQKVGSETKGRDEDYRMHDETK